MSDTNLLQYRKSVAAEALPDDVIKSQSLPVQNKPDVSTLYTTPIDGVPSLLFLALQLTRDVLTFLIRAGLSTMMFSMDLFLRLFVFVTEIWLQIPGAFLMSIFARFVMWCYQLIMWTTYTALELVLYLPAPLLVVYFLVILVLYLRMPEAMETLLHSMWWMVEHFVKLVAYLVFPSYRRNS